MIISTPQIVVFLFVLARIIGLFISAPIFNARTFPASGKVALAVWVAIVLWYVVPVDPKNLPLTFTGFIVALASEVAIGYLLGFIVNIIFIAAQSAGEIIDLQMGLSVAQAFDPVFGASISIIGRLMFYLSMLIFLSVNGHHLLMSAIHQSFKVLPLGAIPNFTSPQLTQQFVEIGKIFWTLCMQFAAPIILLIFLLDFAFGIVSRVAPQVNVFSLGFQVKPMLGLIGLIFTMPLLVKHLANLLGTMGEEMLKLMVVLK